MNPIDILNGAKDKVSDALGLGRTKPNKTSESSMFNLESFKAEILGKGLAEEDRFEVVITIPNCLRNSEYEHMQESLMRVEQTYFPPLALYTKQLKIFGPAEHRPVMADYGGDGLTMTFLMDRDMKTNKMFDHWLRSIVDQESQTISYQEDYICDISIRQLDRNDSVVYEAEIQGAFPKTKQVMNLSMSSTGQYHRLQVTFAYQKWKVKDMAAKKEQDRISALDLLNQGGDPILDKLKEIKSNATDWKKDVNIL